MAGNDNLNRRSRRRAASARLPMNRNSDKSSDAAWIVLRKAANDLGDHATVEPVAVVITRT